MTTRAKLIALHARLIAEQRALLLQAAEAGTSPSSGALARTADLEGAILAIETMIEEGVP